MNGRETLAVVAGAIMIGVGTGIEGSMRAPLSDGTNGSYEAVGEVNYRRGDHGEAARLHLAGYHHPERSDWGGRSSCRGVSNRIGRHLPFVSTVSMHEAPLVVQSRPVRFRRRYGYPYYAATGRRYRCVPENVIYLYPYDYHDWRYRWYYDWKYRPPIEVKVKESIGLTFYQKIPPIVVEQRPPGEPRSVIEWAPVCASRQEQLIATIAGKGQQARLQATAEIAQYKNIASVAVLADSLINDDSAEVRMQSATSLGQIGGPLAWEVVRGSLHTEQDHQVRQAAQDALAGMDDTFVQDNELCDLDAQMSWPVAPPGLSGYLERLRYGRGGVREEAVRELAAYRSTWAVAALINAVVNDQDADVRKEAGRSLGRIGDPLALGFLEWAGNNDLEKSVRKEAQKAIEKIKCP